MSGTVKALVLQEAVRIWSDPGRRSRNQYYGGDDTFCAIGALGEAEYRITGTRPRLDDGYAGPQTSANVRRLAEVLGIGPGNILLLNMFTSGQRYLFKRMQRALAKELA